MYGSLVIKSAKTILQEMINYVVARTLLTDLLPASVITQVLAAAARSDETIYLQIAKIPDLFAIRNAKGEDLSLRALDYNTQRQASTYATGTAQFTRTNPVNAVLAIPAGTQVSAGNGRTYVTLVATTIPALATQSAVVGVIALQKGSAFNADIGAISVVITSFSGPEAAGLTATNSAPLQNGRDEESDPELRARLAALVLGLNRTSPLAIPARATQISLANGSRVATAKLVEDPMAPAYVDLYIDNGTGTTLVVETYGDPGTQTGEILILAAGGGEARFEVLHPPIARTALDAPDISLAYRPAGGGPVQILLPGVGFHVITGTGDIKLDPVVFPAGLGVGDRLDALYDAWGGLVREVQWDTNGRGSDPFTYPGGCAAGCFLTVRVPEIYKPAITVRVGIATGYDGTAVRLAVKNALLVYINGLGIGDDIVLAELYDVAMAVPGVANFLVVVPAPADPAADVVVGDYQLVRLVSADLTVV